MKAYEDVLYEQWRQQVEAALPSLLKKNLIVRQDVSKSEAESTGSSVEKSESADDASTGSNSAFCSFPTGGLRREAILYTPLQFLWGYSYCSFQRETRHRAHHFGSFRGGGG